MPSKTLYQLFVCRYASGCGSTHCSRKGTRVCLARGRVPCDVLFIGEAPGRSENVIGQPFIGPAGRLMDYIIGRALPDGMTHALTNLVGCIPLEENGDKATEPDEDQIQCCSGRLISFVRLARPRLIVCVGRLAADYADLGYRHRVKIERVCPECREPANEVGELPCPHRDDVRPVEIPRVPIHHPAYLLRLNVANRDLEMQRSVIKIRNAVEEMPEGGKSP